MENTQFPSQDRVVESIVTEVNNVKANVALKIAALQEAQFIKPLLENYLSSSDGKITQLNEKQYEIFRNKV